MEGGEEVGDHHGAAFASSLPLHAHLSGTAMKEHDWHSLPAPVPMLECWACETVYDPEGQVYFKAGEYDKPGLPEDPGCKGEQ